MKKLLGLVLGVVLLSPAVAFAGGAATSAALGLGAFAVFNQVLAGVGIFGPPRVYAAPAPAYVAPAPVYAAPAPVYVAPAPVYVAPRPVVVAPAPLIVGAPVVIARPFVAHQHVIVRGHPVSHHGGHPHGW
jgi:hypothetical protein